MNAHEIFAMIDETGMVQNVIVCSDYTEANRIAQAVYGDSALAVYCQYYPCTIGDVYRENRFYRILDNGSEKEIAPVPTQEQQVAVLNEQLLETELALVEQYEANLSLQEEVTNTQIAIAEFYEAGGAV